MGLTWPVDLLDLIGASVVCGGLAAGYLGWLRRAHQSRENL